MAIAKWIGGFLGWIMSGNILGVLAGIALGSLIDDLTWDSDSNRSDDTLGSNGYADTSDHSSFNQGNRNSFLLSLLVLASYIIRADGKVMHSEMEIVRNFLRHNFGESAVRQGEQIMLRLFEEQKRQGDAAFRETIRKSSLEITMHTDYSTRLQLVNFLIIIAHADGTLSREEVAVLREVADYLRIDSDDVESMMNMNYQSYGRSSSGQSADSNRQSSADELARAYKVLGINPSSTDDEVKKAYRKMALKHHPDRVATLGDDVKKAAEQKFKEINEAKEKIFKSRGL